VKLQLAPAVARALEAVPQLLVTIDTEPDCDVHWARSKPLTFTSVTEGVPRLLRPIFNRHGVRPLYFVSPEVLDHAASCRVLRDEVGQGAIIGAHLHSEYIGPARTINDPAGAASGEFPCSAHPDPIEREKLRNLTDLIEAKLGVRPVWYRAARFGADRATLESLVALGYRFDSSVTPGISWAAKGGPDHSPGPVGPYQPSRRDMYREAQGDDGLPLVELPVTILGPRFGPLGRALSWQWMAHRWLRPTHMSGWEMRGIVDEMMVRYEKPYLVMMFHSMEIMPGRSPYVRGRVGQALFLRRLESAVAHAQRRLAIASNEAVRRSPLAGDA